MLSPEAIEEKIRAGLPDATIEVRDLTGTGDHFEAKVVSQAFAGESMIEQHKRVYAALDAWLKTGELHALALKTYTPEQWARLGRPKVTT
jgi:stress-induced morphogen